MIRRELALEDYLGMLRRRWPLLIVLAVVGAIGAYVVSRYLPNQFTSASVVLVEEPTVPANIVTPVANSNINQTLALMRQEVLSRERLEPLIRQSGVFRDEIDRVSMDVLVDRLQQSIVIATMRPPDENSPPPGFNVKVTTDKPQTAQAICAAVTSMFIEENVRRRQEQSESTTQFLTQQIADAKTKLDEQDGKLAVFQGNHPGSLPDDEQMNLGIMSGLTSELGAITQELTRAQQDKSLSEAMLSQQIAARQASQTGKNPQTLEDKLAALQTQLADLQSRYTDDYPDIVKTTGEIASLQKKVAEADAAGGDRPEKTQSIEPLQFIQLRAQIRADAQAITEKTKMQQRIQEQISDAQNRIRQTPGVQQEYKQLTRDHQSALEFYNSLLRKESDSLMASNLEHRQESEQFHVLNPATQPTDPSSPNRPLFALGGMGGGLALGLCLTFLLEMRDTSLRTEKDVELQLQVPVVAVIPSIDLTSSSKKSNRAMNEVSSSGSRLGVGA